MHRGLASNQIFAAGKQAPQSLCNAHVSLCPPRRRLALIEYLTVESVPKGVEV